MKRLSISINESDYNIFQLRNINISAFVRRELARIKRDGLSHHIDMQNYEYLSKTPKHRLSVNLISDNPAEYYGEDYKLPFVIRCIISQYADNLRRHE